MKYAFRIVCALMFVIAGSWIIWRSTTPPESQLYQLVDQIGEVTDHSSATTEGGVNRWVMTGEHGSLMVWRDPKTLKPVLRVVVVETPENGEVIVAYCVYEADDSVTGDKASFNTLEHGAEWLKNELKSNALASAR